MIANLLKSNILIPLTLFFVIIVSCSPVEVTIIEPAPVEPAPNWIDSIAGKWSGICAHAYRHDVQGQLVTDRDTSFSSMLEIVKIDSTLFSITGCGTKPATWGNYLFPEDLPTDTVLHFTYHVSSMSWNLDINIKDRIITTSHVIVSGGPYFESWSGYWKF